MVVTATETVHVTLRGGLTVGLRALQLLWEARGARIRRSPRQRGYLMVSPKTLISTKDDPVIRACRDERLQLGDYCDAAM
jgi:hypothetical protein